MKNRFPLTLGILALVGVHVSSHAQQSGSSVTIYGTIDVGIDRVSKAEGNVSGTVFGVSGGVPIPNAVASPRTRVTRVAPSLSAQSLIGFKGQEDLGSGYFAKFALESGFVGDTGTLTQDGRMFGRQAWVGLTTPYGEFRLGRQGSPMLAAYYLTTLGYMGSTDIFSAGVTVNHLQVWVDNAATYIAKTGPWTGIATYSPNAGVAARTSAARAPNANATTGQIVGGATAGIEDDTGRGRTGALALVYTGDQLVLAGSYNHNKMNTVAGLAGSAFVPLFNIESFDSWLLSAKYTFNEGTTRVAANLHTGRFKETGDYDPKTRTIGLSVGQAFGRLSLTASAMQTEFTNFTEGKDKGFMAGGEYLFSRRTSAYFGWGFVEDKRGRVVGSSLTPAARLAGGPGALLLPLGALELPIFSGAGMNLDARTRITAVGLRHTF